MSRGWLQWVFGLSSKEVVHECRTCGVSVGAEIATCPACGRSGIARYEIARDE